MDMSVTIRDAGLDAVMRDTLKHTKRSAKSLVMSASIFFIQSARKATKKARKNAKRDIIPVNKKRGKRTWKILVLKQNKPNKFIYTKDKNDKRRLVKTVGAAKNSWNGALKGLGKQGKLFGNGSGKKLGKSINGTNKQNPKVTILNFISYLNKINPGLASMAMSRATSRMRKNLDRKLKKDLERKWK